MLLLPASSSGMRAAITTNRAPTAAPATQIRLEAVGVVAAGRWVPKAEVALLNTEVCQSFFKPMPGTGEASRPCSTY